LQFLGVIPSVSDYRERRGNHVEERTGMLNLSIVGRNATPTQRSAYTNWDKDIGERATFVKQFYNIFPDYEASIGGQISIDIVPKGQNKSIVLKKILKFHAAAIILFFGDRMEPGGNDRPLAQALSKDNSLHQVKAVRSFNDTWQLLKTANREQGGILK